MELEALEAEQVLREYLQRETLPEDTQERLEAYQLRMRQALDREERLDGNRVQEISEQFLALEGEILARMGKPALCILCPRLDHIERYPPASENKARMEFRCGHSVHSQCYINILIQQELLAWVTQCLICNTHILDDNAVHFHRANDLRIPRASAIDLWENNPSFRTDLKALCKQRSETLKTYKSVTKEIRTLLNGFKSSIDVSVQTISLYKKEYSKKLTKLQARRQMLRSVSKYNKYLSDFTKKYNIWSSGLRVLIGRQGVPRLSRNMTVPYRFRRSVQGLLRTVY
jgi:dsRNA-specific ribonuclease